MENNLKEDGQTGSSRSSHTQGPGRTRAPRCATCTLRVRWQKDPERSMSTTKHHSARSLPSPSPWQMREGSPARLGNLSNSSLSEPADSRRAHPPGQAGFGAKVSTGSYLTSTPAPNPANGRLEMSRPLVLNQQSRAAETAACQDGAGLNYPRSR